MDEDTAKIDLELIANDLEKVAKLAGRLNQTDTATEIGALVAKVRAKAGRVEGKELPEANTNPASWGITESPKR